MIITRYNKSRELAYSDNMFTGELYGQDARLACIERLFIERGVPMTGKKIHRIFARAYAQKVDPPLSFADHHHVAIAFARQLIGAKMTLQHIGEEELDPIMAQKYFEVSRKWHAVLGMGNDKSKDLSDPLHRRTQAIKYVN
ncbi:hypothetical protein BDB00DRAFT_878180 [Zychaea mexicana]|uniref:uncharacterized protein n=1 Tax=Zychaea mexicana TaxID=64656 RepID=UPI0022FF0CB0|nr:uncharacterized protein BDB00DRAFT_878180 [Zychaea mexicana]KAI9484979.1 hypothetical protein BDB00DRAFT_878180 [Zychaea mexicana]